MNAPNPTYALQVLPPALSQKQWSAYTGLGKSSFFDFARRHDKYAVVRDGHGNKRIKREWVDAFLLGRLDAQAELAGVELNREAAR